MLPDQSQLSALVAALHAASPANAVFLYAETLEGAGRQPLPHLLRQTLGSHVDIGGCEPVDATTALQRVRSCLEPGDESSSLPLSRAALEQLQQALAVVMDGLAASLGEARLIEQFWLAAGHPAYPELWDFALVVRTRRDALLFMGSASSA